MGVMYMERNEISSGKLRNIENMLEMLGGD